VTLPHLLLLWTRTRMKGGKRQLSPYALLAQVRGGEVENKPEGEKEEKVGTLPVFPSPLSRKKKARRNYLRGRKKGGRGQKLNYKLSLRIARGKGGGKKETGSWKKGERKKKRGPLLSKLFFSVSSGIGKKKDRGKLPRERRKGEKGYLLLLSHP